MGESDSGPTRGAEIIFSIRNANQAHHATNEPTIAPANTAAIVATTSIVLPHPSIYVFSLVGGLTDS